MIVVAVPAYNEANTIGSVILRAKKHVDTVIVIDDGSSDSTSEIAKLAGVDVIKHEKNRGYGATIKSCFLVAQKLRATVLVIIDADGQHDPDEIPKLTSVVLSGDADVVIGSRFLKETDRIPAYRRFGIGILTTVTNIGSKKKSITDSQSGFRAFSKKAIDQLDFTEHGMGVGSEILMDAQNKNMRIKEVEINCNYKGIKGSTYHPISQGLAVLYSIINYIRRKRPLLFFGFPGLIFLLIGLFLGIWTIDIFIRLEIFPVGKAILSVLLVIVGMLSIFTALILTSISEMIDGRFH